MKYLLLLTFLLLVSRVSSYSNTGLRISDLFTDLTTDANSWTFTNNGGSKYGSCDGKNWLGWYLTPSTGSMQRTYTNLPNHNSVAIIFSIFIYDTMDIDDYILVTVEGISFEFGKIGTYGSNAGGWSNYCESSNVDPGYFRVLIYLNHNADSLTFKVDTKFNELGEGFGINGITITSMWQTVPSDIAYYMGNNVLSSNTKLTSYNGWFNSALCSGNCLYCKSSSSSDCIACQDGYYLENGQCLSCSTSDTCLTCISTNACGINICSTSSKYYYPANSSCSDVCEPPFTVATMAIGNNKCVFPCTTDYLAENGTCLSSCTSPYVAVNEGGYKYCYEAPCRETASDLRKFYYSPFCYDCPHYCANCTSATNCSACRDVAVLSNNQCVCPSDYFLNDSSLCQPNSYECYIDDHCTGRRYCDSIHKCRECYSNSHCPELYGMNRFCSSSFVCVRNPSITLLGPDIISGELSITLFYLLTSDALSYNISWLVNSTSSNTTRVNLLKNYISKISQTSITIPPSLLEKGVEYHFIIVYNDSDSFVNSSTLYIKPSCPKETFLIIGQGCIGRCSKACYECDDALTCKSCAPFAMLNSTTLQCDMYSTIFISASEKLSPKAQNTILAIINQNELGYYTIQYNWAISSVSSSVWPNTTNFLSSQKNYLLNLPGKYLQPGATYTLHTSYLNYKQENISTSIDVVVGPANIIALQVDGGSLQILQREISNNVRLFNSDPTAYYSSLISFWTQTSGSTLFFKSPTIDNPLTMNIPTCNLKEGSTYKFKINYMGDSMDTTNSLDFTAITRNDSFTAEILDGNRTHPSSSPLTLESQIIFSNDCPDTEKSNLLYKWICRNYTNNFTTNCSDQNGLFETFRSSSSLTVPNSYYSSNQAYIFTLQILRKQSIASTVTEIFIGSSSALIVKLKCIFAGECTRYYSKNYPIFLQADVSASQNETTLTYEWTLEPSYGFVTLYNKFFFVQNSTSDQSSLKIHIRAFNSTHSGESYMYLSYNYPPIVGNFTAEPSQGEALTTYFTLSTPDWFDEDQPLRYQYFYSFNISEVYKSLGDPRLYSELITLLTAIKPSQTVYLKAVVYDIYSASSESNTSITVTFSNNTFSSLQEKIQNMLSTIPSYDTTEMAKSYSLISSQMQLFETQSNTNACPSCSGNGNCSNSRPFCICNQGWAGADCSVTSSTRDSILSTKLDILNKMTLSFTNETSPKVIDMVVSALSDLTSNPNFNNQSTINKTETILETKLNVLSDSTVLSSSQKTDVANILSNLINFKSSTDCDCALESCQSYATKLTKYFDKLSSDSSSSPNLVSSGTTYSTDVYDYIVEQVPLCEVENRDYMSKVSTQAIQLIKKDESDDDCSQIAVVKTFAMQDKASLFNCTFTDVLKAKSKLGVSVNILSTGRNITDNYIVRIKNPTSKGCSPKCRTSVENDVIFCECPQTYEFDPQSQIASIFSASELSNLLDFGSLSNWNPITSPVFWADLMIVIWFAATFVILGTEKVANKTIEHYLVKPSTKKIILYNFLSENQLLSIYLMQDKDLSKRMRASIYFVKILSIGLFNAIFSKARGNSGIFELIVQLQILVILLPYWTMLPINIIVNKLIISGLKESPNDTKKSGKFRKTLILIILIVLMSAALLSTFIIANNNNTEWEVNWLTTLLINIVVDLLISPWIQVLITFLIYHLSVKTISKPVEGLKQAKQIDKIFPETKLLLDENTSSAKLSSKKNGFELIENPKVINTNRDLEMNNSGKNANLSFAKNEEKNIGDFLENLESDLLNIGREKQFKYENKPEVSQIEAQNFIENK